MVRIQIISFLSKRILFLILFVFLTYPKFPFLLRLLCHKRNVAWIAFGNVRSFSGNFYLSKSLNIGICLTQIPQIYLNVFWHSFVKPNNDLAKNRYVLQPSLFKRKLKLNETLLRILNAWGETWFILQLFDIWHIKFVIVCIRIILCNEKKIYKNHLVF